MSAIGACAPVGAAARTTAAALVAMAATTVMEIAPRPPPLPPTETEAWITGIATTLAQISIRATTVAGATTPVVGARRVEAEVRISLANSTVSLTSRRHLLLLLHLQGGHSL